MGYKVVGFGGKRRRRPPEWCAVQIGEPSVFGNRISINRMHPVAGCRPIHASAIGELRKSGICEGFQSLFSSMDSEVVCNGSRFGLRQRARLRRGFHQVRSRFQSRFHEAVPQGSSFFAKWGQKVKSTHSISAIPAGFAIPEFVLMREV